MKPDHEVAIIGAGFGGLGMGAALRHAGMTDFVMLERADDIGGTWRDNTYPGVGVDVPSFAYQFTYAMKPDWSRAFAKGAEVKAYIDDFADNQGLRPHIRYGADVRSREWDSDRHLWRLDVAGEELTARHVVSAIGVFVEPRDPQIEGLADFEGKVILSQRWDHEYDLSGKRVAIVGTGASAVQIIPEIAQSVANLDVYQRTPIWVAPLPNPKIPGWLKTAFRRVPGLQRLVNTIAGVITEFIIIFQVVNYGRWPFAVNRTEDQCRRWVRRSVRDPELRKKLTPKYGFGCKRPSISGKYLRTYNRENVELITDPIERITPTGVLCADGTERDVDALILATGFRLSTDPETFRRTPVRGRDGFDLATHYANERLASYEGISMPGLPNHFMVFGPYSWTGGAYHSLAQTAARHIVRVISEAREREATAVEVTPEATDRFMSMIYKRMSKSLWATSNCASANSYYFDHHGDTPYVRPTSTWQTRRAAEHFPLDDYRYSTAPGREAEGAVLAASGGRGGI